MKIGHPDPKPPAGPVTAASSAAAERNGAAAKAAKPAEAQAEPSTQVALSSTAEALSGSRDGDFDAEKVQRIAQAIRDGKFKVNPEAIADKLISNAQELLGKPSH